MTDVIDRASDAETFLREAAIAHARLDYDAPAAQFCRGCGESIPEERRRAVPGVSLCIDCARAFEQRERGFKP
jgi:phage/conjugal plasmid C-4 type zinc finger TraR family protein